MALAGLVLAGWPAGSCGVGWYSVERWRTATRSAQVRGKDWSTHPCARSLPHFCVFLEHFRFCIRWRRLPVHLRFDILKPPLTQGMFVKVALKKGEVILQERPLFVCRPDEGFLRSEIGWSLCCLWLEVLEPFACYQFHSTPDPIPPLPRNQNFANGKREKGRILSTIGQLRLIEWWYPSILLILSTPSKNRNEWPQQISSWISVSAHMHVIMRKKASLHLL